MTGYKIENFTGTNGKAIANQYIILADDKTIFQSYETLMALIDEQGQVFVNTDKDNYTSTTAKYLKQFLEEFSLAKYDRNEVFKAIDDEEQEKMTVNNVKLVKYNN